MWTKLRKYYDKTAKPFAYIDATILHPGLKKKFMKKAGYEVDLIGKKMSKEPNHDFKRTMTQLQDLPVLVDLSNAANANVPLVQIQILLTERNTASLQLHGSQMR